MRSLYTIGVNQKISNIHPSRIYSVIADSDEEFEYILANILKYKYSNKTDVKAVSVIHDGSSLSMYLLYKGSGYFDIDTNTNKQITSLLDYDYVQVNVRKHFLDSVIKDINYYENTSD